MVMDSLVVWFPIVFDTILVCGSLSAYSTSFTCPDIFKYFYVKKSTFLSNHWSTSLWFVVINLADSDQISFILFLTRFMKGCSKKISVYDIFVVFLHLFSLSFHIYFSVSDFRMLCWYGLCITEIRLFAKYWAHMLVIKRALNDY